MYRKAYSFVLLMWMTSLTTSAMASTGIAGLDGTTAGLQAIFGWAAFMLFIVAGGLFIWHHNKSNMHSHMLSGVIDWVINGALFTGGITFAGWVGLAAGATLE